MQIGLGPIFHPMSPEAGAITHLFEVVLVICGFIMALVAGLVGYSIWRWRAKPGDPEPRQIMGHHKLEIAWTVIPFCIVVFIFILTTRAMSTSDPAHNRPPDIVVIGHQWWWEARYTADGVRAASEFHIPTGKPLLLRIESADVLHDFWAPELARKIHAVPGHPNYIWMEAEKPGKYMGECAEFCGTQHAWMRFLVIAESPADFAAWSKQQLVAAPDTSLGAAGRAQKIFQRYSCLNCHSLSGVSTNGNAAPDLTHIAGRSTLAGGVIDNTPDNLVRWLKNPQAIKPGCLMPNFQLTDAQAHDLEAYFEMTK